MSFQKNLTANTITEIQQELNFLLAVIDTMDALVVVLDETGAILRFNNACEKVTGYTVQEVIGKNLMELLIPSQEQTGVVSVIDELKGKTSTNSFINHWLTKDGQRRLIRWNNTVLARPGATRLIVGTGIDITENALAEEKIRSLSRFPEENPNPVLRISTGGELLYANSASSPILQAWQTTVGEIIPGYWHKLCQQVFKEAALREIEISASGRIFSVVFTPVPDEGYINLYGRDITLHKQAEKEREQLMQTLASLTQEHLKARRLAELHADELDAVINAMVEGVVIIGKDSDIIKVNPASMALYGFDPTGMRLHEIAQRIEIRHPDGRLAQLEELAGYRALQGETVQNNPFTFQSIMGTAQVLVSAAPIQYEDHLIGAVVVWHNVTALREAEAALVQYARDLERANQELNDFNSIVSHDLNEPLRKIIVFGNLLNIKFSGALGETGADYIARMQSAATRMQRMIDDLLDYARVNDQPKPTQLVNLNVIAREVISDLEGRIMQTQGQVKVENLPVIQADSPQMRQLFQNLISNALKFHQEGKPPVVKISYRPLSDRWVEILFEDNGIGFDESHLDRIFKPFQRLQTQEEKQYEGTGIGLAICRKIAIRHGGEILAHSTPGEGSTFIVRLPVAQP